MRLSIIIPVYNVEAYIEKCVTSLQQQDIPRHHYEIIIINDGSPDNSRQVVMGLMQQYDNIIFIDQENKGVSLARNAGMDKAKGKFLLFIDPDDYVEPNCFKRVLATAESQNAQIAFLGFRFLNHDGTVRREMLFSAFKNNVYPGIEAYYHSRIKNTIDPDRSVAILFDREFMNTAGLRYISNVPYLEDGEFISRILCLAQRCIFEGNSFYIRTTRPGSATNSSLFYADHSINGFIKAAVNLKQFTTIHPLSKDQLTFMNQPLAKFTLLAVESGARLSTIGKTIVVRKKLFENNLGRLSLPGVAYPYSTYARLYNVSPFLYIGYLWWKKIIGSVAVKINKLFPVKTNESDITCILL